MKSKVGRAKISLEQESEEPLQITVPQVTKRSLKMRAAETGETMRIIVLKALAEAGIQVPQTELQDRRKNQVKG